ncbi:hypothetical protein AXF42_Ash006884 [Apostasia shenzhenica]|uniref:Uncharacterized protein n=1 Tax=Apostasia shenzhenica TaxID=1088818 RepID=A0A2I0BEF6_9ASPA|nr:hypothetical protein AXF42_Ash006884 [Apostasia shenzhenica]
MCNCWYYIKPQLDVCNISPIICFQLKYIDIGNISCVIRVLYKIKVKLLVFSSNIIKNLNIIYILSKRCVNPGITLKYPFKITYYVVTRILNAYIPLEYNEIQGIIIKTLLLNSNTFTCHKLVSKGDC